jgi:hypothetical protein
MRASSVRAEPRNLESQFEPANHPRLDPTAQPLVRKNAALGIHRECQGQAKRPAHPSNGLIAELNERWRVVDDPLQWILQRRKGSPRKKNSGWQGRSFCRTREALLRCVREYCGEVDPAALNKIKALPDWHLDWDRTNLDVHGTAHAQPDAAWEPLAAKALEDSDADE